MKNKRLVIGTLSLGIFLAGCNQNLSSQEQSKLPEKIVSNDKVVTTNEVKSEIVIEKKDASAQSEKALYQKYSADFYNQNLGKKPMVLFFHASWCPTCKKLEKDISEDLKNFPEGTVILETDYDKESELKKKYGVTTQTTMIVLNAAGEQVEKLLAPELADLKAAITKSI